jgi:uncharacterized protein (TIGR02145 family)
MAGRIGPPPPPPTVVIGTQTWTSKNLDVAKYKNGDPIPQVTDGTEWANLTTGAWCYYDNDQANGEIYGKLYNWYAATDPRGLAPSGFHIPTYSEWTTLSDYLGGNGGTLKETGTTHWLTPNNGATNSSGFTALPGGAIQNGDGFPAEFNNIYLVGNFLSSTEASSEDYIGTQLLYFNTNITLPINFRKTWGSSVRCIKD